MEIIIDMLANGRRISQVHRRECYRCDSAERYAFGITGVVFLSEDLNSLIQCRARFVTCQIEVVSLAEEQIKSAFLQIEKEVQDLHTRISQGMRERKRSGKQIGLEKGPTLVTDKSTKCKEIIKKHATDFGGTLSDKEVMILCNISRNSYYKYMRAIKLLDN